MKKLSIIIAAALFAVSCDGTFSSVSPELKVAAEQALASTSEQRAAELEQLMANTPKSQREGMAYLIAYMPKGDLDTLSVATLSENVEYAYKAREEFTWAKQIPEQVFLNDVLPYASINEDRESWRPGFYEMLKPIVKDAQTIEQAIDTVNRALIDLVGVKYSTARNRANQAPSESMAIGMASCSGLSVLLTDALRAVGIPSRMAGTPMWASREGNHSWSEVYIDGEWLFMEYYYTPLNHSWFLEKAAMAVDSLPETWVYATSFKHDGKQHFPMAWAKDEKSVGGVVVTQRYRDTFAEQQLKKLGTPLSIKMWRDASEEKSSQNRVKTEVRVLDSKGEVVATGQSVDVTADMNDYLTLYIKDLGQSYTIEWDAKGGVQTKHVTISEPTLMELSYE